MRFVLKHGSREKLPYIRDIKISCTGFDISYTQEESKAMAFASRAVAMNVTRALRHSYGNYYPIEVTE